MTVVNNRFQGYRNAVNASGSQVTATGNVTREFEGPSIIDSRHAALPIWSLFTGEASGDTFHPLSNTGRQVVIGEGPWKLVVTYGKTTTYALFNSEDDPQDMNDLSARLEQITLRLRGLLEKQENLEYRSEMLGKGPGK